MKARAVRQSESGVALITTLMVMMLMSALMVGFFGTIMADQRSSGIDRDQTQAYAAAHAGLEKLTTDLAHLFESDFSPSTSQVNSLLTDPPVIPGFEYIAAGGAPGYVIQSRNVVNGQPAPLDPINGTPISSGPYQGLRGIVTRYDLTATARSTGAETRLRRSLQTVAIPVFQFGMFSDTDLTFFGGDSFNFGGRVHTNGDLFLAMAASQTLSLSDRVTAASDVVRKQLSNGFSTSSGTWTGTVRILKNATQYRNLATSEGSVVDGPTSKANEPTWTNVSMGQYAGYIRNGTTGAKRLDLPLVSDDVGGEPIDLIRRPLMDEDMDEPLLYAQRYYGQASLRILLSDTATDIEDLPGATDVDAVELVNDWNTAAPDNGTPYGPVDLTHPPVALSPGPAATTISGTSSTTSQVNVVLVPDYYKVPVLTITGTVSGVSTTRTVTCQGRTPNTFTGCVANATTSAAMATGATIAATIGGVTVSNVTTATWTATTASAGNTITTGTTGENRTNPFAPTLIFVGGRPVTCLSYDTVTNPDRFFNCSGLSSAPTTAGVSVTNGALTPASTATIGGFIKIEKQAAPVGGATTGEWTDVTMEILNLGIGAPNQIGKACGDPTPDAVIRLQRLRDNGLASSATSCGYNTVATSKWQSIKEPTNWWPNVMYDTREGNLRDNMSETDLTIKLGGVMYYVALDVANLKKWFAGTTGTTGDDAWNNNGYIVYFSDRRNNRNAASQETAEYGWEDSVNPTTAAGTLTNSLESGEDFNGNTTFETYGSFPNYNGVYNSVVAGSQAPLDVNARPWTTIGAAEARVNRTVLFRRALKLMNGGQGNLPTSGLTVVSENPVYVQGNYNATATSVTGASVPASIMGDAVTILSNTWIDSESFMSPNDPAGRTGADTGYRFAVVAGKGLSFPWPSWATSSSPVVGSIFGTDGGVGNFLRYLENWNASGRTILYKGSIVSLFISRQATGTFKCCRNVYAWGVRNYSFDTNFLTPSLLPPGTPMFRDVNSLTFRQLLRPTE